MGQGFISLPHSVAEQQHPFLNQQDRRPPSCLFPKDHDGGRLFARWVRMDRRSKCRIWARRRGVGHRARRPSRR